MLFPGLMGAGWIWRSTVEGLTRAGYGTIVWNAAVAELELGSPATIITEICSGAYALLDELSIEKVLVCGNSLGALLGLEFAGQYPDRTAGMVLSGCPGFDEEVIDVSYFLGHSEHDVVEEYRRRMFYGGPESLPVEFGKDIEEGMKLALHRPTAVKILKAFRAARLHDTVGSLERVACPTSLIWGEHDLITPLANWMPHIPDLREAELHVIPECGHSPMIEKTDEWLTLVLDFMRGLIPSSDQGQVGGGGVPLQADARVP